MTSQGDNVGTAVGQSGRPAPLGPSMPLVAAGILSFLLAIFPEVDFQGEDGQTLALFAPDYDDLWGVAREVVGLLGMMLTGVLALAAGLLPARRQWMAIIPLGFFVGTRLLGHLIGASSTFWFLDYFEGEELAQATVAYGFPWLLRFLSILGTSGIIFLAGFRTRRALPAGWKVVLVLSILATLTMPDLVAHVLNELLMDPVKPMLGLPLLVGVLLLVPLQVSSGAMLFKADGAARLGFAYVIAYESWDIATSVLAAMERDDIAGWCFALWTVEALLGVVVLFALGRALGQRDPGSTGPRQGLG